MPGAVIWTTDLNFPKETWTVRIYSGTGGGKNVLLVIRYGGRFCVGGPHLRTRESNYVAARDVVRYVFYFFPVFRLVRNVDVAII